MDKFVISKNNNRKNWDKINEEEEKKKPWIEKYRPKKLDEIIY